MISECLIYALENELLGVWGGTTEAERKAMWRVPAHLRLAA